MIRGTSFFREVAALGRFQRAVGVVILGAALLGALLLWLAVSSGEHETSRAPRTGFVFGAWKVLYDTDAPSSRVLLAAIGLALLFAAGVALLERRIATRARRSEDLHRLPLAPKIVMAETRGIDHGPVTITVLVPAHNEAACIGQTLRSLQSQSQRPERIVVVADNCTDATEDIALALGVEVFTTIGNTRKKAGGLNQALRELLPGQGENDLVMVMDADTTLDDGFLEAAAPGG
jgi:cellulose synthase/poly-beta-1,6-N-acetylglucosamine synthase-like glycosyltransferase